MDCGLYVECPACGYRRTFLPGAVPGYSSIDEVTGLIHHTRRQQVQELLSCHHVKDAEYGYRIYRCEECRALRRRFYVRVVYDENRVYETTFDCEKCTRQMTEVTEISDAGGYGCPKCGSRDLETLELIPMEWPGAERPARERGRG